MSRWKVQLFMVYITFLPQALSKCTSCRCADNPKSERSDQTGTTFIRNDNNNNRDTDVINQNKTTGKPRKKCCPYDFDSTLCKIIDDRVLCGYDRNQGYIKSKDGVQELSDGCRLKNGRLECGYVYPPFTNPRRPPGWNDDTIPMNPYADEENKDENKDENDDQDFKADKDYKGDKDYKEDSTQQPVKIRMTIPDVNVRFVDKRKTKKPYIIRENRCVENTKTGRIVCREK